MAGEHVPGTGVWQPPGHAWRTQAGSQAWLALPALQIKRFEVFIVSAVVVITRKIAPAGHSEFLKKDDKKPSKKVVCSHLGKS